MTFWLLRQERTASLFWRAECLSTVLSCHEGQNSLGGAGFRSRSGSCLKCWQERRHASSRSARLSRFSRRSKRRTIWSKGWGNSWYVTFRLGVSGIPTLWGKGDAPESRRGFDKRDPDLSPLRFFIEFEIDYATRGFLLRL